MTDSLLHVPEGDHNPYEAVPWSRQPLEPLADEPIRVGVRGPDHDDVTVQWRSGSETGEAPLTREGDSWIGYLGPFRDESHYRFVGSRGAVGESRTEWFTVPISRWQPIAFHNVLADATRILVIADDAVLTLAPTADGALDWRLETAPPRQGGSRSTQRQGWSVGVADDGNIVVTRDSRQLIMRAARAQTGSAMTALRVAWDLDPTEHILGTGERFDRLDQRGRSPDVRVYEQYKQQGSRTYFPAPWLVSTRGYGLAIDGAARVRFDLGQTVGAEASVCVPTTGSASGRWYLGGPEEVLAAYVSDIGRPAPMPIWAYGPWMSGNEWDSDRRVREVVDRTHAEDVPATVLVIEAWSDESTFYLFNDTEYEPVDGSEPVLAGSMRHGGRWPDPKALARWLHEHDIRLLLWQIPVLKEPGDHEQQGRDIAFAEDAGSCVMTTSGESYRNRGWWFPDSRVIDFTNDRAREWWFAKRAYLLDDIGIDGFKTDGGEHLWGRDVVTSVGEAGDVAANRYPTHYLDAYHEFMRDHGHGQPLTFSRAGFTGSQGLPAHWAGDEDSTWEAYRASLVAGLSSGASGVAFWGWDIAGFSGELPSAELYKRATAMAAFCPIMQYHSEHNEHRSPLADRTPWNVAEQRDDRDVLKVYAFYARLRMNLIPYLFGLGHEASRTGLPLMRAMALEFPEDPEAAAIEDQFLLGSDLLVAPVLDPGVTERQVYLPEGDWQDLWGGTPVASGWTTAAAPLDVIPVYVRGGACLPLWMPETAELGASVGLPAAGSGRLVLLLSAGSGRTHLIDPLTARAWSVETVRMDGELVVSTTDTPQGVSLWLRGHGPEQLIPLPGGDASLRIALGID